MTTENTIAIAFLYPFLGIIAGALLSIAYSLGKLVRHKVGS